MYGASGFFEGVKNASHPPLVKPASPVLLFPILKIFRRVTRLVPISGFKPAAPADSLFGA